MIRRNNTKSPCHSARGSTFEGFKRVLADELVLYKVHESEIKARTMEEAKQKSRNPAEQLRNLLDAPPHKTVKCDLLCWRAPKKLSCAFSVFSLLVTRRMTINPDKINMVEGKNKMFSNDSNTLKCWFNVLQEEHEEGLLKCASRSRVSRKVWKWFYYL